MPSNNQGFIIL